MSNATVRKGTFLVASQGFLHLSVPVEVYDYLLVNINTLVFMYFNSSEHQWFAPAKMLFSFSEVFLS